MLSSTDKLAGRFFRERCATELARSFIDDPPTYTVPVVSGHFRHPCPKRRMRSTALQVDEVYRPSPELDVITAPGFSQVQEPGTVVIPCTDPRLRYTISRVHRGLFAFIYRAGRCRFCGQTARSRDFRLVLAHERPPLHGRGQGS